MQAERLDERDPRILDPRVARPVLPPLVGREYNAKTFDAHGLAVLDDDTGAADARDVAVRDKPREEIELTIGPPRGRRVQHALLLERVALLGHHDRREATKRVGHGGSGMGRVHECCPWIEQVGRSTRISL